MIDIVRSVLPPGEILSVEEKGTLGVSVCPQREINQKKER